jgi:hypothetical protein
VASPKEMQFFLTNHNEYERRERFNRMKRLLLIWVAATTSSSFEKKSKREKDYINNNNFNINFSYFLLSSSSLHVFIP